MDNDIVEAFRRGQIQLPVEGKCAAGGAAAPAGFLGADGNACDGTVRGWQHRFIVSNAIQKNGTKPFDRFLLDRNFFFVRKVRRSGFPLLSFLCLRSHMGENPGSVRLQKFLQLILSAEQRNPHLQRRVRADDDCKRFSAAADQSVRNGSSIRSGNTIRSGNSIRSGSSIRNGSGCSVPDCQEKRTGFCESGRSRHGNTSVKTCEQKYLKASLQPLLQKPFGTGKP